MDNPAIHFSAVFMAFFAIVNPVANAPVFASLTDGLDPEVRRSVAWRAVLLAFAIVAVFTVGGRTIYWR